MKTLIAHLSDLHFNSEDNLILNRVGEISKAIRSRMRGINKLFIIISGDIVFSGRVEEYNEAMKLIDGIKKDIEDETNPEVKIIIVPGNHDCDFESKNKNVRNVLINSIQSDGYKVIDESVIDQCCDVQNSFFEFHEFYCDSDNVLSSNKILNIIKYNYGDYSILFNCYNTSWISQLDEKPGKMFFPVNRFSCEMKKHKANLVVSILHHPFNWQDPSNSREFRTLIEDTSDIVLTGHDHISTKSMKNNLNGNYTEYVEGDVLQECGKPNNSGFNIIILDLENEKQILYNYKWSNDYYCSSENADWFSYKRYKELNNKKTFVLNEKFEERLNDPGASFTHPNKSELFLEDLFVFPDLRNTNINKSKDQDSTNNTISSRKLYEIDKSMNKIILMGGEKSGKSCLCRIIFKEYYNRGYVPIIIDGYKINSTSIETFDKLLARLFKQQYINEDYLKYQQLEKQKKILIIDNFDKTKINNKYKSSLLRNLDEYFPNIIITANDLFQFEEIISGERTKEIIEMNYQQYEIQEFGHLLRSKLIKKWNLLGDKELIDEKELIYKNNRAKQIIDNIIGKNFVPSYPIFLLTILQSIEAGTSNNLKQSSFGYYYHFLINQALMKTGIKSDDIDSYNQYLTEYANYLFVNRSYEISKYQFIEFHKYFCNEYRISPSLKIIYNPDEMLESLFLSRIFEDNNGTYKFRYKYLYYFFLARYISINLSNDDIRQRVIEMCKRLYREEFANVIMFLTYHTKDPIIIDQILSNAKSIFPDIEPIKFEDDILLVNNLLKEIPKLVFDNLDVNESNEKRLQAMDEVELADKNKQENNNEDILDYQEALIELDIISKVNLAFKTIEILGQILKNYHGSLKGNKKYELCEEAYLLGLRSLNLFFKMFADEKMQFIIEIRDMTKSENLVDKKKVEDLARRILFEIFFLISYVFIKKISESVGSEKLSETFKEILDEYNKNSFYMVDVSIKLDFYKAFPYTDIKKLAKKFSNKNLPLTLLKRMVVDYLYMFHSEYKDKQRICAMLGITMREQRRIDTMSTRKKKK